MLRIMTFISSEFFLIIKAAVVVTVFDVAYKIYSGETISVYDVLFTLIAYYFVIAIALSIALIIPPETKINPFEISSTILDTIQREIIIRYCLDNSKRGIFLEGVKMIDGALTREFTPIENATALIAELKAYQKIIAILDSPRSRKYYDCLGEYITEAEYISDNSITPEIFYRAYDQ